MDKRHWYNNGEKEVWREENLEGVISENGKPWKRGRTKKPFNEKLSRHCKNNVAYWNPETGKKIFISIGEQVPEGFVPGWGSPTPHNNKGRTMRRTWKWQ